MCLFFSTLIILSTARKISSGGAFYETDIYDPPCTTRYEYSKQLKDYFIGCEKLIARSPVCGKNVTLSYMEHPPYVFHDVKNNTVGILPGMIKMALDTCCFGCNHLTYTGPFKHVERFAAKNATLVLPVQSATKSEYYMGHRFIPIVEIKEVTFIGPKVEHDPEKTAKLMVVSIFNTWPLFVTALAMATTAGVCIWLLDSRWNNSEFPTEFPRGPFEGFWWAFVSMTTVGYGDRKPKSVCARLFAVLWILAGMTIFSMYTASLSSALTTSIISTHRLTMFQKKVGILHSSPTGKIGAIRENAKSFMYESLEEMQEAMFNGEIEAMALDENMANFYMDEMTEFAQIQLYHRSRLSGSSYGVVAYDDDFAEMLRSFFASNEDIKDVMAKEALPDKHDDMPLLATGAYEVNNFFSPNSPLFPETLLALFIISFVTTATGLCFKWVIYKRCKTHQLLSKDKPGPSHITVGSDVLLMINDLHDYTAKTLVQKAKNAV